MPEGDTLFKVARAMGPLLVGQPLVAAELARRPAPLLVGRTVRRVAAVGKHLLVEMGPEADGWTLRVHLGMTGSWHRYGPGEPWRKPRRLAGVVLAVADHRLVCFSPRDVELWPAHQRSESGLSEAQGPDLLAPEVDIALLARRARKRPPETLLVDLLLDQRVAAGMGNVYKSELLFLAGLAPSRRLGQIDGDTLEALYASARCWLQRNLGDWRRTTTFDRRAGRRPPGSPRLYVYGRGGERCLRCSDAIVQARLGRGRRSTYWCPTCQPAGGPAAARPRPTPRSSPMPAAPPSRSRLPAEWQPQRRLWLAYPWDEASWGSDLAAAQREFVVLAAAIAATQEVALLVRDADTAGDLVGKIGGAGLWPVVERYGDIWLRDTGPLFVAGPSDFAACFAFNGWGGRYLYPGDVGLAERIARRAGWALRRSQLVLEGGSIEVDGRGLALTTRQCLRHPNRNPGRSAAQVADELDAMVGIERLLWLDDGLLNDHTDGHIDTLARFVAPGHAVAMRATTASDPNRCALAAAEQALRQARGDDGSALRVSTVPSPGAVLGSDGAPLPASYLNFIICNTLVVVPTYGVAADQPAVAALAALFPGRRTVGLSARALLTGGGAFHCMSQPEPPKRSTPAAIGPARGPAP